jgi:malate dehydrogenase
MKVAVLGAAGAVGAPTAFFLAVRQLADEIVMIGGRRQNLLQQHVMDMRTAVSSKGVNLYAGTYEDLAGSHIVINAAGLHRDGPQGRGAMLEANVPLMLEIAGHIKRFCPDAVIITATNPVGPLNYATYLAGGFDRRRVIGYSLNDTLRLRELTAEAFQVETHRISGVVLGEHGSTQVPVFSSIQIDGRPVTPTPEIQQRIRDRASVIIQQFQALKADRTAGWTCAVGLGEFVRAVVHNAGTMLPCSVVLDGEYGQHGLSMSVPAIIGRDGAREIQVLDLTEDEAAALAVSTAKLAREMRLVERILGPLS